MGAEGRQMTASQAFDEAIRVAEKEMSRGSGASVAAVVLLLKDRWSELAAQGLVR